MLTIDQWNATREKISKDESREERLRQKAMRRGLVYGPNGMRPAPVATGHNRGSQPACQTRGPGTEMKRLLQELDIPSAWCESCSQKAATMDGNGIVWCRDNRETIIQWLREAEAKFATDAAALARGDGKEPTAQQIAQAKQAQRWRTGWAAAKQLLWINPVDPFGSFVDEAIRRAEAVGCQ